MGTDGTGDAGVCHHDRADVPDREVRDGTRAGLFARRRGRDARGHRPHGDCGAVGGHAAAIGGGCVPMTDPAASFEPHRRRLRGLAYRMLGSVAEAEDAVQDAYLRWHATDRTVVSDPRGFLTTTTARICLDVLRSARTRRETYVRSEERRVGKGAKMQGLD